MIREANRRSKEDRHVRAILVILVLFTAAPVQAQSAEQDYIAAHDRALAALKKKWGDCRDVKDTDAMWAEAGRFRPDLEALMRRVLPAGAPKGFPGPGQLSPAGLYCDEDEADLDGIALWKDNSVVIVTTEGLLRHWLQAHKDWWKDTPLPVDPQAAFRSDTFYSMAVGMGAAFSGLAELPVDKPAGTAAAALLGSRSNGGVFWPPGRIAVAVMKGGKVHVADVELTTKFAPAAGCDALKANDPALEAYGKCWEQRFRNDSAFAAATRQAQALVDALAGK
jgi:hypothetical protein